MSSILCCSSGPKPYRPQILLHEPKFRAFVNWIPTAENTPTTEEIHGMGISADDSLAYVVQVVRQVNYGPLESKRYFLSVQEQNGKPRFREISEDDLIQANYEKLNAYKNFKCDDHNRFFEMNIYKKDPVNAHHWRANIARPAADIDLKPQQT